MSSWDLLKVLSERPEIAVSHQFQPMEHMIGSEDVGKWKGVIFVCSH